MSANGSISVAPAQNTIYTITATGPGGTATSSTAVTVSTISLQITSPLQGEWISRRSVVVQGTITNVTGNETGVTVNGVLAQIYGNTFEANHVPLGEGGNTITVTAIDAARNSASASVMVNADVETDYVEIVADAESGIPPLEITLYVRATFAFNESSVTDTGPGAVEYLQRTPQEYRIRLTSEGSYHFMARVVDNQNNVHTDALTIAVVNRNLLDVLLKSKWNGMRTALINSSNQGALEHFLGSSRERYAEIFDQLATMLPRIASEMREIELIYAKGRVAKYRIKREEEVQGQVYDITYYVYFAKDPFGIWRIREF